MTQAVVEILTEDQLEMPVGAFHDQGKLVGFWIDQAIRVDMQHMRLPIADHILHFFECDWGREIADWVSQDAIFRQVFFGQAFHPFTDDRSLSVWVKLRELTHRHLHIAVFSALVLESAGVLPGWIERL